MTDKQIIVDDVNVKDCKRRIGKNNYCRYYKRLCSENNYNCIWKKYLRKEQECEKLKKELIKKDEIITFYMKKDVIEAFFNTPTEGWSNDPCGICRYKQTLTEIKPILEFYANSNMGEEQSNGTYKILSNGICITIYDPKPARQALQKIREVENDNTRNI